MSRWQWVRERWQETRWGMGIYLTAFATFVNLVLLISLRFAISGFDFIILAFGLFVILISASLAIGNLHRRWQQDTDARLTNKAIVDDIVRQIREGLQKDRKAYELENR